MAAPHDLRTTQTFTSAGVYRASSWRVPLMEMYTTPEEAALAAGQQQDMSLHAGDEVPVLHLEHGDNQAWPELLANRATVYGANNEWTQVILDTDFILGHLCTTCLNILLLVSDVNGKIVYAVNRLYEMCSEPIVLSLWISGDSWWISRSAAIRILSVGYVLAVNYFVYAWFAEARVLTRKIIRYDCTDRRDFTSNPNHWTVCPRRCRCCCRGRTTSPAARTFAGPLVPEYHTRHESNAPLGAFSLPGIALGSWKAPLDEEDALNLEKSKRGFYLWCGIFLCALFAVPQELRSLVTMLHPAKVFAHATAVESVRTLGQAQHRFFQLITPQNMNFYNCINHLMASCQDHLFYLNLGCLIMIPTIDCMRTGGVTLVGVVSAVVTCISMLYHWRERRVHQEHLSHFFVTLKTMKDDPATKDYAEMVSDLIHSKNAPGWFRTCFQWIGSKLVRGLPCTA